MVGRPLADALINRNATVTLCHSKTTNLKQFTKKADIIISSVGKKNLITKEMVKENFIGIDVGITIEEGNMSGDFKKNTYEKASYITPIPGGVGPLTVSMAIENLLELERQKRKNML